MKRWIAIVLLVWIAMLSGCGQPSRVFDGEHAWRYLEELSDESQKGRMTGTSKHDQIAKMIAREFKELGLSSDPDTDEYLQPFTAYTPELKGTPVFEILDGEGRVKRTFIHREEYAEITGNFACGGSVGGPVTIYRGSVEINQEDTAVLLLPDAEMATEEHLQEWIQLGVQAVIRPMKSELRGENHDRLIKSVYMGNQPAERAKRELIMLAVPDETIEDLIEYAEAGDIARIEMPLEYKKVNGINVVGMIEGTDTQLKNELVLVTAHYDHVGMDPNGTVYPGALDNASGVATLMELARFFAAEPTKRSLVFVAFDAEESGLQGSKYFAYHAGERLLSLEEATVINLDMIGSAEPVPLTIATAYHVGSKPSSDEQLEEVVAIITESAKKNDVPVVLDQHASSSDHMSFLRRGIPAVSLAHMATGKIHTMEDALDNCSLPRMAQAGGLLVDTIAVLGNRQIPHETVAVVALSGTIGFGALLWVIGLVILVYWRIIRKGENKKRVSWVAVYLVVSITALIVSFTHGNHQEMPRSLQALPWNQTVSMQAPGIQQLDMDIEDGMIFLSMETNGGSRTCFLDAVGNQIKGETPGVLEEASKGFQTQTRGHDAVEGQEAYAYADEQGRNHMVVKKQDQNNLFRLIYQWQDQEGVSSEPIVLAEVSKEASWCFAMDQAMGVVVIQDGESGQCIRFPLGTVRANMISVKPLALHDQSGALLSFQEFQELEGQDDHISFFAIGSLQTGESMIVQLDFQQGKLVSHKILEQINRGMFTNLQVIDIQEYQVAAWIDKENEQIHLMSSNPLFALSDWKKTMIMAVTYGTESLVQGGIVMLTRLYWMLPGILFLLVWLVRKEQMLSFPIVNVALVGNWIFQIFTYGLPHIFGLAYENWIISAVIAVLTIGIVWVGKKERGKNSPVSCFVLFTFLNLFFLSILYAPAIFQLGLTNLNELNFF